MVYRQNNSHKWGMILQAKYKLKSAVAQQLQKHTTCTNQDSERLTLSLNYVQYIYLTQAWLFKQRVKVLHNFTVKAVIFYFFHFYILL